MKKASRTSKADSKEVKELKLAVKALEGSSHNPINWIAIIKFIAPLVARIAGRYAAKYVAGRLNKRLKIGISRDAAEATADRLTEILAKTLK